jgi:transcriptional regulator of heat shock response
MNTSKPYSGFWSKKTAAPSSSSIRILPAEVSPVQRQLHTLIQNGVEDVRELFRYLRKNVKIQPSKKRLRVCESVSLGEKRFIAVVQLDGKEFLVGGAPNSLSLLASVGQQATFLDVLNKQCEQGGLQG